jgi:hypothetical protein
MALRLLACLSLIGVTACSNSNGPKPSRVEQATTTITATVEAIDLDSRTVTLRGPTGGMVTLKADESVKNLSQLKVGDRIRASYHESLAVRVRDPGEPADQRASAAGAAAASDSAGGAGSNGMPVVAQSHTVTATVQAVDRKRSTATLTGPAGEPLTVRVDPKRLENVNVGDEVDITYTESLAVALEKVGEGAQ